MTITEPSSFSATARGEKFAGLAGAQQQHLTAMQRSEDLPAKFESLRMEWNPPVALSSVS